MKYFYGYLEFGPRTINLTAQQLIDGSNQVAGRHILTNTPNGTGNLFKKLISAE
jgi:hypothetical protein